MSEPVITQVGSQMTVRVGSAVVSWERGAHWFPPFTVMARAEPGHLRDLIGAVQAAQALYIEQYTAKGAQR